MLPQPDRRPSAHERARTLLEFASSAVLDVRGADLTARPGLPPQVACALRPDGSVAVLVGRESALHRITALARGPLTAELDCVDVAPVAVPHRIRGRLQVQGLLSRSPGEDPAALFPRHGHRGEAGVLLRLEPDHLALDDLWGSECCLDPDGLAAAEPDPVAAEEACLLQHLATAHTDQLRELGARALDRPDGPPAGWHPADRLREVRPVALDRRGLRVRLLGSGSALDARFEFHRPVAHPEELPEAMHRLFAPVLHGGRGD
ncbi:DUF2470 domain-containing protein [Kitasatospora sp. NPDC090308]|uniref:DUF2470 domain-containing protein n=1 Tax=Kitasatospora sp. NPDC090308 TaxID=3364082 RepID=UPI0038115712